MEYIEWLKEGGVANIEMESTCFAALTYQAGIRSAIVCVTLLDRLNEDQVTLMCDCDILLEQLTAQWAKKLKKVQAKKKKNS